MLTIMKKLFLICIALCFALAAGAQDLKKAYVIHDGADMTVFDYRVRYNPGPNVHLYYKGGKLMMKIADPHMSRKVMFVRKLRKDGTIEPLPDTLKGPAMHFIEREVYVDDTVAVRVKSMIKSLKLGKIKDYYDNKYKKDEIRLTGGSFWEVTFLDEWKDKEGVLHHYRYSGGRFSVNNNKTQKQVDKYIEKIRAIAHYLQNVQVKYCPTPQEKSDDVIQ